MATVKQYSVPVEGFPRYKYAKRVVSPHNRRCQKLFEVCGLSGDKRLPEFQDVMLYVHSIGKDDVISIEDLLSKKEVKYQYIGEFSVKDYAKRAAKMDIQEGMPVVDVVPHSYTEVGKCCGRFLLCVAEDYQEEKHSQYTGVEEVAQTYVCVTSKAKCAMDLCNLLERFVFRSLKERVSVLQSLAEADTIDLEQTGEHVETSLKKYSQTLLQYYTQIDKYLEIKHTQRTPPKMVKKQSFISNPIEILSAKLTILSLLGDEPHECSSTRESEDIAKLKKHIEIVRKPEILQNIKDLEGEAHAMFLRSNVPESERPASCKGLEDVPVEVPKELFKTIPSATGCGYRYNTFQVWLDQNAECNENEITEKAKNILSAHGIDNFVLCPAEKEWTKYCTYSVGSEIYTDTGSGNRYRYIVGSLGGFAKMTPGEHLCLLTAKHVTVQRRDVNATPDNKTGVHTRIARALAPINANAPSNLDIAACKVDEEAVRNCEKRFKDSDGYPMPSQLFTGIQLSTLSALDVHIWGAKSKPGKGRISVSKVYHRTDESMKVFIAIEEIPEAGVASEKFAKEGDSGAIVCADDPDGKFVHVISMFMGGKMFDRDDRKQKYMTFFLSEGLRQLSLQQNANFEIY